LGKEAEEELEAIAQTHLLSHVFLTWHVWEKMAAHWTYLTPVGMCQLLE